MSKSYGNTISLSEDVGGVEKKVLKMMTDPARVRRQDVGNPDVCPVFDYHKVYTADEKRQELDVGCRTASIGCVDCKKVFLSGLIPFLKEHQERRKTFENNPKKLDEIVEAGRVKARKVAQETLRLVYEKMGL